MNDLTTLAHNPTAIIMVYGFFWVLSTLAQSMPPVSDTASFSLRWLYNFLQLAAANINLIRKGPQK